MTPRVPPDEGDPGWSRCARCNKEHRHTCSMCENRSPSTDEPGALATTPEVFLRMLKREQLLGLDSAALVEARDAAVRLAVLDDLELKADGCYLAAEGDDYREMIEELRTEYSAAKEGD